MLRQLALLTFRGALGAPLSASPSCAPAAAAGALCGARGVHSARMLRRLRGHPRTWPPAKPEEPPAPSALPLRAVVPMPSGWAAPLGEAELHLRLEVLGEGAEGVLLDSLRLLED